MQDYTVVLIYPDYIAENYGEEFYIDTVEAESPQDAVKAIQSKAMEANSDSEDGDEQVKPEDFALVACFRGSPILELNHLDA